MGYNVGLRLQIWLNLHLANFLDVESLLIKDGNLRNQTKRTLILLLDWIEASGDICPYSMIRSTDVIKVTISADCRIPTWNKDKPIVAEMISPASPLLMSLF